MKREEFEALIGVFDAFITVRINKDENSILEFESIKASFIDKFVDKEDVEFKEGYSYIEKTTNEVVVEGGNLKPIQQPENDKFLFKLVPDIKPIEQQKQLKLNKNIVIDNAKGICKRMFEQNASVSNILDILNNQHPDYYYFYISLVNWICIARKGSFTKFIYKIPEKAKFNDEDE